MISKYIRKDLQDYSPYHAMDKAYDIKVDANENPYAHSPIVLERVKQWLENKDHITRYPDTDSTQLRTKIASLFNITKENVVCGVGSDQILDYISKLFIEPGDKVLVPNPSFSMYGQFCAINHGVTVNYELDDDFNYNVDEIIKSYNETKPKMLYICNPNNPTGSKIGTDEIERVLQNVDCPVVVDEAYVEFHQGTMIDKINKYNHLIVLRTFSKAYGLAGLRVGYAIACEEMIEAISICKEPYNLNSFSQIFAEYVIDEKAYYMEYVNAMKEGKDWLITEFENIELCKKVYPSVANYILIKVKDLGIVKYLEDNKVLVRAYGNEGRLRNCIRISIGTKEENARIIALLKNY